MSRLGNRRYREGFYDGAIEANTLSGKILADNTAADV